MNRTSIRRAIVPGVAALAMALTACGASNESGSDAKASEDFAQLSGELKGGGATSQEKAQEAWKVYVQGQSGGELAINYGLLGSTDGRSQFVSGALSFAGSDSYMKDDEGELTAAKERCNGEDIIEVPAYLSPIGIAFHLEGVKTLQLDADTLAKIFDLKITKWNDPAIADQNDGVDLPDMEIATVHRADDSGTTKNFTDYLGKASKSWKYEAEDAFPVSGGQAADGTSGVIATIKKTNGTIGYADNSQVTAEGLTAVSIKVGEAYVAPSPEGAAKVLEVSPRVEDRPDTDMAVDLDRTTTEDGAYPIVLLSYLIACQHYADQQEADNVKGYLSYIVSDDGQAESAKEAGSAPLSAAVATEAQEIVARISKK